jgi:hypothetical protein
VFVPVNGGGGVGANAGSAGPLRRASLNPIRPPRLKKGIGRSQGGAIHLRFGGSFGPNPERQVRGPFRPHRPGGGAASTGLENRCGAPRVRTRSSIRGPRRFGRKEPGTDGRPAREQRCSMGSRRSGSEETRAHLDGVLARRCVRGERLEQWRDRRDVLVLFETAP